ncbi:MAG: prolyl oligopeptidase family serine peptidase [Clostridia bacterium]|nr:prolyl oligopeptidase family serine peptidase [Clostridia bacterium]
MAELAFTEDKAVSQPYRAGYLKSVQEYLSRAQAESAAKREAFMPKETLAEHREEYRTKYRAMLGRPLADYETLKNTPVRVVEDSFVADDGNFEIRRLKLDVLDGFTMYGVLFLPDSGVTKDTPFVISQHGGWGTPELCSDFFGDSNYNHQTRRVLSRGAVVFAPQLLLWNVENYGDPYDRQAFDAALKQVGSSITALEVFGLMRCLDYFVTQPYCNPDHIGMVGLSYGGFYTLMTTAADPRIRSAYASCSFIDKIKHNWFDWTWQDSADTFLDAEIAALIAPRHIAFDAGDNDNLFGSESTKSEFARAKSYFAAQGVEDHIFLKTFPGTHELCPTDEAMDFFASHL